MANKGQQRYGNPTVWLHQKFFFFSSRNYSSPHCLSWLCSSLTLHPLQAHSDQPYEHLFCSPGRPPSASPVHPRQLGRRFLSGTPFPLLSVHGAFYIPQLQHVTRCVHNHLRNHQPSTQTVKTHHMNLLPHRSSRLYSKHRTGYQGRRVLSSLSALGRLFCLFHCALKAKKDQVALETISAPHTGHRPVPAIIISPRSLSGKLFTVLGLNSELCDPDHLPNLPKCIYRKDATLSFGLQSGLYTQLMFWSLELEAPNPPCFW